MVPVDLATLCLGEDVDDVLSVVAINGIYTEPDLWLTICHTEIMLKDTMDEVQLVVLWDVMQSIKIEMNALLL